MDPNSYRYYECNLKCPNMKTTTLRADVVEATEVCASTFCHDTAGIYTYSGSSATNTTHTLTSSVLPVLANPSFTGELTCYVIDKTGTRVVTCMTIVQKIKKVSQPPVLYQKVGNFDSIVVTMPTITTIRVVLSHQGKLQWVYRGI